MCGRWVTITHTQSHALNTFCFRKLSKNEYTTQHLNDEGIHINAQDGMYYATAATAVMYELHQRNRQRIGPSPPGDLNNSCSTKEKIPAVIC